MEPEIACLRSTFGRIEALISRVPNIFSRGKDEGLLYWREYSVPEQLSKSVQGYGTANELGSINPAVVVSRLSIPECSCEQEEETVRQESKSAKEDGTTNKVGASIFSINRELLGNDVMILKYLFSDFRKAEDRFSSLHGKLLEGIPCTERANARRFMCR